MRMPVREREGDARNGMGGKMGETGQEKRQQEGGRKESGDMGTSGEGARAWGNRYAVLSETTADIRHVHSGECSMAKQRT